MNVITASNLRVPMPSADFMRRLKVSLAGFATPCSGLTTGLMVENWDGPQAVHTIYSVATSTIVKGLGQVTKPISFRFLAGRRNEPVARVCWTSPEVHGLPAKVVAATEGAEAAEVLASTERLNYLQEVSGYPAHYYEVRVLRVPTLFIETFWLKALSGGPTDLVVPYAGVVAGTDDIKLPGGKTLKRNQSIPLEDFLTTARAAADARIKIGPLKARRPAPPSHPPKKI